MLIRQFSVVILGLAVVVACQPPQPEADRSWEGQEAAIRESLSAFEEAVLRSDWAAAAETYSQDAVIMVPNQLSVEGREGWREWVASMGVTVSAYDIEIEEIYGSKDLAFVRGTYAETLMADALPEPISDNGKFVQIWRMQPDGTWLATIDVWNSNEPLPEAGG